MARKNNTTAINIKKVDGSVQEFKLLAPTATKVELVGDFTDWQERPIHMLKLADGVWRANVSLPPGIYLYRFIADGEWWDDPESKARVSNPYGSLDSIREVV